MHPGKNFLYESECEENGRKSINQKQQREQNQPWNFGEKCKKRLEEFQLQQSMGEECRRQMLTQ